MKLNGSLDYLKWKTHHLLLLDYDEHNNCDFTSSLYSRAERSIPIGQGGCRVIFYNGSLDKTHRFSNNATEFKKRIRLLIWWRFNLKESPVSEVRAGFVFVNMTLVLFWTKSLLVFVAPLVS